MQRNSSRVMRVWKPRHQVVFLDESRISLWDHVGVVCVGQYADQRCLLECIHGDILSDIVAEQQELQSGVRYHIMDDPIL